MYKIMLVDDEASMRNRMLTRIKWEEYGFQIVADAENGIDALEKFEQFVPDVLITDIKMPFMDGLELSQKILENYPLTKIIILTGFDDFEYAQKAINLNVIDYILKPITHDNTVKVLEKTRDKLDSEFQEKRDVNKLKEYFEKSYPLMRNHVLYQFVSGRILGKTAKERLEYYNIQVPKGPYRIGIIQQKKNSKSENIKTHETNRLMLYESVNSIIEHRDFGTTFIYDDSVIILFAYGSDEDEENKKLESTIYEIDQYIDKFMAFSINISIGHKYDTMDEISISYNQAMSALDYTTNGEDNEIAFIWDVEPDTKSTFLDLRKSDTIRALKTGSVEDVQDIISRIFTDIEINNIREKDYKLYLLEYVFDIIKNANLLNVSVGEEYSQDKVIAFMKDTSSLFELKNWTINLACSVTNEIIKQRDDKNVDYTQKAIKYINDNYTDPDLNINKLSHVLYISPTYFCAIFKKNTDSTFNKYLTDVRLEKAKELIEQTDKKNFEIASLIGFADANYFSYCFKKNVGISPSQYRQSRKDA